MKARSGPLTGGVGTAGTVPRQGSQEPTTEPPISAPVTRDSGPPHSPAQPSPLRDAWRGCEPILEPNARRLWAQSSREHKARKSLAESAYFTTVMVNKYGSFKMLPFSRHSLAVYRDWWLRGASDDIYYIKEKIHQQSKFDINFTSGNLCAWSRK